MGLATLDIDGHEWLDKADETDPGSYDYALGEVELRLATVEPGTASEPELPADLLQVDPAWFVGRQD